MYNWKGCLKCNKRELGCHAKCAEYIAFREKVELINKAKEERVKNAAYVTDQMEKSVRMRGGFYGTR